MYSRAHTHMFTNLNVSAMSLQNSTGHAAMYCFPMCTVPHMNKLALLLKSSMVSAQILQQSEKEKFPI
jgi:hypothetical protein